MRYLTAGELSDGPMTYSCRRSASRPPELDCINVKLNAAKEATVVSTDEDSDQSRSPSGVRLDHGRSYHL